MKDIAQHTGTTANNTIGETKHAGRTGTAIAEIAIQPRRMASILFISAVALIAVNLLSIYLEKLLQLDTAFTRALAFFFDVGREGNIPTLFSTLILTLAALQLWLLYRVARVCPRVGQARQWLILMGIFLFLTVDEATSIHEQFNKLRSFTMDTTGYLYYAWILPYAIFAGAVGLYFLGFLRRLPARTRRLFIISGVVFVTAAIGFEPIQGRILRVYEIGHLYDKLLSCAEEFLEMASIVLFNYALSDFLAASRARISFPFPAKAVR